MTEHYHLYCNGGELKAKDIKDLLKKSYDKKLSDQGDFKIDKSLSGQRAKVYHNDNTGQTVIAHKGTHGFHDLLTDGAYYTTGYKSNRFKHAEKIQKQTEDKYGNNNVSTIGHSLGASLSKTYGNNSKEIIAYNRPIGFSEIKHNKNSKLTDIRTSNDPFSQLSHISNKNGKEIVIPSRTNNLFEEHKTHNLGYLNPDQMIGGEIKKRRGRPRKH